MPRTEDGLCCVEDCINPVKSNGLCHSHYERLRLGRPLEERMRPKTWGSIKDILDFYAEKTDHGFIWTGNISVKGYGIAGFNGKTYRAHRLAWEFFNGPIPEGLELDHDLGCPKNCVTIDHLTPRTKSEHAKIGWERGQFDGNGWTEEARTKRLQTKNCEVCGKEFTRDSKATVCSTACNSKRNRDRRKALGKPDCRMEVKNCTICGKEFFGESRKQTCSQECAKIQAVASRVVVLETKICKVCGKQFERHPLAQFCSNACKAKDYRARTDSHNI